MLIFFDCFQHAVKRQNVQKTCSQQAGYRRAYRIERDRSCYRPWDERRKHDSSVFNVKGEALPVVFRVAAKLMCEHDGKRYAIADVTRTAPKALIFLLRAWMRSRISPSIPVPEKIPAYVDETIIIAMLRSIEAIPPPSSSAAT